jgi:hypothetical protein
MKRFFYLSGSLFFLSLTLLIGFHLGARTARADWNPVGTAIGLGGSMVVNSAGEVWEMRGLSQTTGEYRLMSGAELPVPPSQVKFISQGALVTTSDEGWVLQSGPYEWVNIGPVPGGPIAVEPTTWGSLKQQFVK